MGILPLKKRVNATNAVSRQNSVCLGFSLSMRSFAIEEPGSPVPALYATLPTGKKIGQNFVWPFSSTCRFCSSLASFRCVQALNILVRWDRAGQGGILSIRICC